MPTDCIRCRIFRAASLHALVRFLKTGDEHATIDRLIDSKHVRDLQLVVGVSCIAVFLLGCLGGLVAGLNMSYRAWHWYDALFKCLTYGGPVLVVFGGVISWAYKAGSSRLGVVDLFGCEISTLCRVTKVIETVRHCVYRVEHTPAEHANAGKTDLQGLQFTLVQDSK